MENKNHKRESLILKFGGNIFQNDEVLRKISNILNNFFKNSEDLFFKILIITGGGNRVNDLRKEFKKITSYSEEINDEYHWKAIKLMDQNAEYCYSKLIKFQKDKSDYFIYLINDLTDFLVRDRGIFILKPYNDLKKSDSLPHSWGVTSDSISIYYANRISLDIAVLVKDIDYLIIDNEKINHINSKDLKKLMEDSGYSKNLADHLGKGTNFPIDPVAPQLIEDLNINTLLLNGKNIGHFKKFLDSYKSINLSELSEYGTLIKID